jgi:hypothetical protein
MKSERKNLQSIITALEAMDRRLGLIDEPELDEAEIQKWAQNDNFVKHCKINILKYELIPDDVNVYCGGMKCGNCPFEGTACSSALPEQIVFMRAVFEASES